MVRVADRRRGGIAPTDICEHFYNFEITARGRHRPPATSRKLSTSGERKEDQADARTALDEMAKYFGMH